MTASDRIAYYATRFPLVEIETTYRFPPTPAVCRQWADRTPDGFTIDVDCWSLLTGQPTMPASLWEDLVGEVRPDRRDRPKLYASHLSPEAVEVAWARFVHSLTPLVESGRLGSVILRFPRWFSPRDENRFELERVRARLGSLPAAVEFVSPDWVLADCCESTFSLLEDLDFSFVCIDASHDDPRGLFGAAATTSDIGIIRLIGRRSEDPTSWTPSWRGYRYRADELTAIARRIEHLASGAREMHVLVSTCWRDDAVVNAEALRRHLTIDLRSAG